MTDLDQRITSVLREHAEGETDTHRLLRESRARGRRRQLRRRVAAGTALALVGVAGFAGVTGTDVSGLTGRLPWTAATPATAAPPVPPRADGVPGAAADPARVGTDPRVLHFGVDPAQARYLGWGVSNNQVESIRVETPAGRRITVEVARSEAALGGAGIEGFPVDLPRPAFDGGIQRVALGGGLSGYLTWFRPAAGLFVRASITGGDPLALTRGLEALRWDEARRCAAPVRLDALPADATVDSCRVDLSSYPGLVTAQLGVRGDREQHMAVWYRYAVQAGTNAKSNRTFGGRPAYVPPNGWTIDLVGVPKVELRATFDASGEGFTEADAGTLLAGARLAEDPTRLETWP
ncbi:hypothetical protein [Micromonospora sp. NPDC005305]|uniref:hypothetical protein n=1 Tax=Micromonospora sp. NPDC005305 TaxID=3156875 RepID=UPI0033B13938